MPVDFETVSLPQGLARAGFDASQPAFFSWLGVSMYLDEASIIETLRFIGRCAPGSAVVFDYITPFSSLPMMMRIAAGQPLRSSSPVMSAARAPPRTAPPPS